MTERKTEDAIRLLEQHCSPVAEFTQSDLELRNIVFALQSDLGDDPRLQEAAARWAERRREDADG